MAEIVAVDHIAVAVRDVDVTMSPKDFGGVVLQVMDWTDEDSPDDESRMARIRRFEAREEPRQVAGRGAQGAPRRVSPGSSTAAAPARAARRRSPA